ncbi:MAG: beta strand repeat-containing protein [Thermocladium sp.]
MKRLTLLLIIMLAISLPAHATTILLTGASVNGPITGTSGATYTYSTPSVFAYLSTTSSGFLIPNTWSYTGTSSITTYSAAEETTYAGSSTQYYTAVVYGSASTDANGFPTGLSSVSGNTNGKIGSSVSVSGTGVVASAFFSPSTGSSQYYLHCDAAASSSSTAYFTFIISNGTWTWIGFTTASLGTSVTGVTMTGPSTYWTSGNYIYACAVADSAGLSQVGTVQISAGTTSEGTSTTPSSTWYPLNPAPSQLDTAQWWTLRLINTAVTSIGGDYLIGGSGSTAFLANPTPSTVTLNLINLGATPTASINGTSITLGTTYYYIGGNLYLTVTSPNSNTQYTTSRYLLSGSMSLETVGASNPNYYAGPAALPSGTNLDRAIIQPTQLNHLPNIVLSFSFSVNNSLSFTSSQGTYGNGSFTLWFKPGDSQTIQATSVAATGGYGNLLFPDTYSAVTVSGNASYVLPYAGSNTFPVSGGVFGAAGGYMGPSLLAAVPGTQVVISSPPPGASASIGGLTLSIPDMGPFHLFLGVTGTLTLTYGNNSMVTSNAPLVSGVSSTGSAGYMMTPINGYPPLYYLANQYGGITVIARVYNPSGILLGGRSGGWVPFIYIIGNTFYFGDVANGIQQVSGSGVSGWNTIIFEEYASGGSYYITAWLNGANLGTKSTTASPVLFNNNFPDYLLTGMWRGWPGNGPNYFYGGFSGSVQYIAIYGGALPSGEVNAFLETGLLPPSPFILYTGLSLRGGTWIDLMGHSNATSPVSSGPLVAPGGSASINIVAGHVTYVNFPTIPSLGVGASINATPTAPTYTITTLNSGLMEPGSLAAGGAALPLRLNEWLTSRPLTIMASSDPTASSPYLYPTQPLPTAAHWPSATSTINTAIIGSLASTYNPMTLHIWGGSTVFPTTATLTINGSSMTLLNNSVIYVAAGDSAAPSPPSMTYWVPPNPVLPSGTQVLNVGSGSVLYAGAPAGTALTRLLAMNSSVGLSSATFTVPVSFTFINGTRLPAATFTLNTVVTSSIYGFLDVGGTSIIPSIAVANGVHWFAVAPRGSTMSGLLYVTESQSTSSFTGGSTLIGLTSGYWGPSVWLNATLVSGIQEGQYASAYISFPKSLEYTLGEFDAVNPGNGATSSVTSQLGSTIYLTLGGTSGSAPGPSVSVTVTTAPPPRLPISPIPLAIHMDTPTSIVVYGSVFALVILFVRKGQSLPAGLMLGGGMLLIIGMILGTTGLLMPGAVILILGLAASMAFKQGGGNEE